jgi:hypothetical protein
MVSQSKSKAQRRADSQRRAAERRAAELRAKRLRVATRGGGVLVVVAAIVVIILLVTGGSNGIPASDTHPHVATVAIPASMKASWIQPPATKPGPETVPVPSGAKLATLANDATGQPIDGVQCQDGANIVTHVHTHLTIFVNGKARVIPYGIGIPGYQAVSTPEGPFVETGSCFYWLHTHAYDGILHVESPSTTKTFKLGQFFAEWGQPLSSTQVGPATGKLTVFFDGRLYKGDPADLPLGYHYQIQIDVGSPIVAPVNVTNWGGL